MLLTRGTVVAALGLAAPALAACSDPPAACLGDCTLPIELAPTGLRDGVLVDLVDGGEVDIRPPDQGGFVIYVGVRAKNVHARGGSVSGALRGLSGGPTLTIEERPAAFVLRADGWAIPESAFQDQPNLPVCGPVPGPADFDQTAWQAVLSFRDSDGRTASTMVTVQPRCGGWADCECSCQFDRTGPCTPSWIDAGVDARLDARLDAPVALDAGADAP
ncbi:MAG: hypothetical protein IPH44_15545 [Myxococcales bacterium]|nr:hypothetical protein [Myxococcales bacterium]